MSPRLTQFSLLALVSSAMAAPVMPSGSGSPFYGAGNSSDCYWPTATGGSAYTAPTGFPFRHNRHGKGFHSFSKESGKYTMEALDTAVAVGAATGSAAACTPKGTYYTTTTDITYVTVTAGEDSEPTVASSSSYVAPTFEVSSEIPTSTTPVSADSTVFASTEAAAVASSLISLQLNHFSFSHASRASTSSAAAIVAPSSTPVVMPTTSTEAAPVVSSTYVAPVISSTSVAEVPVPTSTTEPTSTVVPTSTVAATSTKPTATSAPVSSGGKRGVAFNDASLVKPFIGEKPVSWSYNWGSTASGLSSGIEYVPMLWSAAQGDTWEADAKAGIANGATALLGFNEPDHSEQANTSPSQAATDYKTMISDAFGGGSVKLGAPAVTNGGAPMGLTWLSSFMDSCSGCQIDFIPIHWYDAASNVDYFKNYVSGAYDQFKKPLWITEFGATGSDDEVNTFLETVLPWLDSQDYVERYSYFMASEGKLISGGALSTYGKTFASFTS